MTSDPKREFSGRESDWLAVDKNGNIGHFSTAGYGPVPLTVYSQEKTQEIAFAHLQTLPTNTEAVVVHQEPGDRSDWIKMAERGIFSYDFKPWRGPYLQIARPRNPIRVADLPANIASEIDYVTFEDIAFKDMDELMPFLHPKIFGT